MPFLLHRHRHTAWLLQYLLLELRQPSCSLFFRVRAIRVGRALLTAVTALCAFAHHWCCWWRRRWGLCRLIRHLCKPHLKDILQKGGGKTGDKRSLSHQDHILAFYTHQTPHHGSGSNCTTQGAVQVNNNV